MKYVGSILAFLLASFAFAASEAPQTFTLDGRLYSDSAGTTPLTDADVDLVFQILDNSKTCILYEETRTNFNAGASNGYFAFQIGSVTGDAKRSAGDNGLTMKQVYSNTPVVGLNGKLLSNNATLCAHSPTAGQERFLRVQVTPSSDNVTRILSPFMAIDSVPNAMIAEHAESAGALGTLEPSDVLQVKTSAGYALSQSNLESIFTSSNFSALTTLLAGNSTLYNRPATNGTTVIPSIASPTSPSAGQVWYNAGNILYHDGTTTRTISTGSSSSVAAGNGTAALPSISFSGDTDTGWYLAAPDTLAAATGGVERARIDENGNFGLGSASPGARLTLGGNQTAAAWGSAGIGIRQNSATYTDSSSSGTVGFNYVNAFGIPTLAASTATTYTNASAFSLYPPQPGANVTLTNSTGLTVNAASLTGVTSGYGVQVNAPTGATNNYAASFMGGNVGVGTTAPTSALDVTTATGNTGFSGHAIKAFSSTATSFIEARGAGGATAFTSLRLLSEESTPKTWQIVHKKSGTSLNNALTFEGNDGSTWRTPLILYMDGTVTTAPASKVGIGVTSPTASLMVKAGTATAGTAPLKFATGTNLTTPEDGAMEYSSGALYFTVGSTRYTIPLNGSTSSYTNVSNITNAAGNITMSPVAASGAVVIDSGTTSTSSLTGALRVSGGVGVTGDIYAGGSLNTNTYLSVGTNAFIPQIYGGSAASANIKIDGTSDATKGNVLLSSAGGNVGIGTTAPLTKFDVLGANSAPTSTGDNGLVNLQMANSLQIQMGGLSGAPYTAWMQAKTNANNGTTFPIALNPVGGNVGIGTTSPTGKFTVVGDGGTADINQEVFGSAFIPTFKMYKARNTAAVPNVVQDGDTLMRFQGAGYDSAVSRVAAQVRVQVDGTPGTGDMPGRLMFDTTPDGTTSPVERMRIDNAGRVGIGATAPSELFNVIRTDATAYTASSASQNVPWVLGTGAVGYIQNAADLNNSAAYLALSSKETAGNIKIGYVGVVASTSSYGNMVFGGRSGSSNVDERMRINLTNGNVGIGTTAPWSKLVTNGNDANNQISIMNENATASRAVGLAITSYEGTGFASTPGVIFNQGRGSSGAQTATQSGDILGKIEFNGNRGGTVVMPARIRGIASQNQALNANGGALVFDTTTNGTNSSTITERMRIDNTGFVGIGTTSPEGPIHFKDAANTNAIMLGELQGNTSTNAAGFIGRRGRDSSGTLAPAQAGDYLVSFGGRGYLSASWAPFSSALMAVVADDDFSTGRGTKLQFETTPVGSTSRAINMVIGANGNVAIGNIGSPTARLQIKAGTATAGTAPLKLTAGTNLTTPEAGAIEFDGTNLYYTNSSNARQTLATAAGGSFTNVTSIANSGGNILMSPAASTGAVTIDSGTTSSSSTTGALIVTGGAGVSGNIFAGGTVNAGTSLTAGTNAFIPQIYGSASPSGVLRLDGTSDATKGDIYLNASGGKIGIGTTAPARLLDISTASSVTGPAASTGTAAIGIMNTDTTTGNSTDVNFISRDLGGTDAMIGKISVVATAHTTSAQSGDMLFITRDAGAKAERMRISSGGYVGIGTTSPDTNLVVSADSDTSNVFVDAYGSAPVPQLSGRSSRGTQAAPTASQLNDVLFFMGGRGRVNASGYGSASSAGMYVKASENFSTTAQGARLQFETTPTGSTAASARAERMRIENNGFVGIGTTAPFNKLDVAGATTAGTYSSADGVRFHDGNYGVNIGGSSSGGYGFIQGSNYGTGAGDIQLQPFGGNVGIGTTSASDNLHIKGTGNVKYRIQTTSATNTAGSEVSQLWVVPSGQAIQGLANSVDRGITGTVAGDYYFGNRTGGRIMFSADTAYARTDMTIRPNGYVGIGTTNPGAPLSLATTATATTNSVASDVNYSLNPASNVTASYIGQQVKSYWNSANNNTGAGSVVAGVTGTAQNNTAATVEYSYGLNGWVWNNSTGTMTNGYAGSFSFVNNSTGTITNAAGLVTSGNNVSTGTINTAYGIRVNNPSNSGTINSYYGLYLTTPTAATTNYALYSQGGTNYFGGSVGIGVTSPSEKLEVSGGSVKADSFITNSDARLKHNIRAVEGFAAISRMSGHRYILNSTGREELGLIAQEVEQVFPEAVVTNAGTGLKAVKYQSLIAPMIEAIKDTNNMCRADYKELAQKLAQLEKENAALRADFEAMKNEVAEIKRLLLDQRRRPASK